MLVSVFLGSILSKKGAEGLNALVLDVKFGKAALYKDLSSARNLAQSMVGLHCMCHCVLVCKTLTFRLLNML